MQETWVLFLGWEVPLEKGKATHSSILAQVVLLVKNPPAMQETRVPSLCQEDALEKGMATRSIILVWRIPWTEETGGRQSIRLQRVGLFSFMH